jgi:hypothetical protein
MADDLTAEQVHQLLDPFAGANLRVAGQLGTDAHRMHLDRAHLRIVDDEGDDVAFVGHPVDGALLAAAPQLARQLLACMEADQ